MSLRLVMGPARSGKSALILRELAEHDPMSRVFYIVPEQMTLSSQQKLLEAVPGHGVMNTEVLSFNRLAHRIFEEVGLPAQTVLDDMGKSLLLYRIAGEHREELSYYGRSVRQSGFIGQLKLMVTEMLQYCLSEEEILKKLEGIPADSVLAKKWQDILLLYRYYNEEISEKQISSEQLLDFLSERLDQSRTVAEAEFYFDEFSGFTPQQYRVLEGLAKRAKRLTVSLALSERAYFGALSAGETKALGRSLFHETQKSFLKLRAMAASAGIGVECVLLPPAESRNINEKALERLREGLFSLSEPALSQSEGPCQQAVYATAYPTVSAEHTALMHEILHLLREEGYRLRDIAVLDADMEQHAAALRRELDLYGLNAYLDNKTALSAHPFASLLLSLFSAAGSGWSLSDSVSVFKTGLSPLSAEEVDLFENELLASGCHGRKALCERLAAHLEWPEAEACAEALAEFAQACEPAEQSVSARSEALRRLLERWAVRERMEQRALATQQQAESLPSPGASPAVYLRRAAEYAQLWDKTEEILKRMDAFLKDAPLSLRDYCGLLSVAFSQCRLSTVPPSMDQLLVGDLYRTHLTGQKIIFITGFTESAFPGNTDNPGLFNRKERADMRKLLEMAPDSSENVMLRYYSLYSLLGKASERVYFSCSLGNASGEASSPALQWNRLKKISCAKEWPLREEATLPYPTLCEEGADLPEEALSWLLGNGYGELLSKMALAGQKAAPDKLAKARVKQLLKRYGAFSVSQAECYAGCPFSYYMQYLLRLEERREPEVRRLEDGTVLHEVLEASGEWFRALWEAPENGQEEPEVLVQRLFAEKENDPGFAVYQTTARYRYYWEKLEESAKEALTVIRDQLLKTQFRPSAFEWEFGGREIDPVTIRLSDGEEIRFRGKIDRIDVLDEQESRYLRIIDYKSGQTRYSEQDVLAGTSLQLPIYMEAALEKWPQGEKTSGPAVQKPNRPAGFFYFHLIPEDENSTKLNGLLLEDSVILEKMDNGLAEGEANTINASYTKDGALSRRGAHYATAEQFGLLGRFARRKAAECFENISAGEMTASPLEGNCTYCAYQGVCGFDPQRFGALTRRKPEAGDDFYSKLRETSEITEESK